MEEQCSPLQQKTKCGLMIDYTVYQSISNITITKNKTKTDISQNIKHIKHGTQSDSMLTSLRLSSLK